VSAGALASAEDDANAVRGQVSRSRGEGDVVFFISYQSGRHVVSAGALTPAKDKANAQRAAVSRREFDGGFVFSLSLSLSLSRSHQSGRHVVSARALASAEDNSNAQCAAVSRREFDGRRVGGGGGGAVGDAHDLEPRRAVRVRQLVRDEGVVGHGAGDGATHDAELAGA